MIFSGQVRDQFQKFLGRKRTFFERVKIESYDEKTFERTKSGKFRDKPRTIRNFLVKSLRLVQALELL